MEQSLQFLALEQLVGAGVIYDPEQPQVNNILFDVRSALLELEYTIYEKSKKLDWLRKRFVNNKIYIPDFTYYNIIRDEIENILFDNFECDNINHIQWKEYFHSTYNLVTIPRTDRYTTIILLRELLKYYDMLSVPIQMLEPEDPMSHSVHCLLACFRRLREIHIGLLIGLDIVDYFKVQYELEVQYRTEYFETKQEYNGQLVLRDRYKDVLERCKC